MHSEPPALGTHPHLARTILGLVLLLFGLRIIASLPALSEQIPNLDEVEMAWSVLDRALGVPSTTLAWPNSLLQLLSLVPTLAVQVASSQDHGLDRLVTGLALGYRSPWQVVFVIRIIVAAAMSAASGLWLWVLLRDGVNRTTAILFILLGTSAPALWMASTMAKGEGLALALLMVAFAVRHMWTSPSTRTMPLVVGAIAGAVLASRNTLAPGLIPLAMYTCGTNKRAYATWVLALVTSFVSLCPSVWLEPVRLAKSVAGNVARPSAESAFDGVLAVIECTPPILWLLGLTAIYRAFTRRRQTLATTDEWRMAAGVLAVTGALLLLPLSGRQVSPGYFVSLPCLLWLVILLQAPDLANWLANNWQQTDVVAQRRWRVLLTALGLLILFQSAECVTTAHAASQRYEPMRELKAQLLAHPRKALLPRVFLPYFAQHVPSATFEQLSTVTAQAMVEGNATTTFLANAGLSRDAANALRHNFDEDEQAFVARSRVAASISPRVALDLAFYDHLPGPSRYGMKNINDAVELLASGEIQLLVVMGHPLANHEPTVSIQPEADWAVHLYARAP